MCPDPQVHGRLGTLGQKKDSPPKPPLQRQGEFVEGAGSKRVTVLNMRVYCRAPFFRLMKYVTIMDGIFALRSYEKISSRS